MPTKKVDPRNKRTRPAKGEGTLKKPVQFYVDAEMKAVIDTYGPSRGLTSSEWLRRAVKAYQVKQDTRKPRKTA